MCTIEIHVVVLPLANRWGTMLSSGKRIWFCISKLEPNMVEISFEHTWSLTWLIPSGNLT